VCHRLREMPFNVNINVKWRVFGVFRPSVNVIEHAALGRLFLRLCNTLVLLILGFGLTLVAGADSAVRTNSAAEADGPHVGLAYDRFPLTLAPGERTEAVGPFYYTEDKDTESTWAVPPLLSYSKDPAVESKEFDFFYPVLTYERFGAQYRWQLFQLLSLSGGETQTETNRDRFTIFPVYFQQRSSDTNENYTAVVPFYGHLKHRLLRDEIFFVMFPCYSETRKKDVVTDNYLYPFFHLRHGDELKGWQLWPFYGQEHKGVTHLTNGFGDVTISGGHDKMFVLWPFYFNQHNQIGTENPQWVQGTFPFYDFLRSPQRDATTVIWPLFTWINDREKKYREWQMPWPIVVIARGEGKHTTRVFPLFSHAHSGPTPPSFSGTGVERPTGATNAYMESDFYVWPLYKYNRLRSEPLDRERTRILFFLYSDTWQKNTETGASRRRRDFWPLYTYQNDYNGNSRLQIGAILEPFLPTNHKIERDWSPLWSFWRSEKNPREQASSQSLLWNLYRHQTSREAKSTSVLFGLFQHHADEKGKTVKLFYIPIHKSKNRGVAATQPGRSASEAKPASK